MKKQQTPEEFTRFMDRSFAMILILAAIGFTAAGMLIGINTADAHVPDVQASCRVLEVTLTDYEPESAVTITVDGASSTTKFAGNFHKSIPWSPEKPHTWLVRVDNRGDGKSDQWDQLWTGTSQPCVAPTTTALTCSDNFQSGLPRCTPIVPPTTVPVLNPPVIERFNPTTPVETPAVLDRTPAVTPVPHTETVLAFTGFHAWQIAVLAALFLGAGGWMVHTARAIGRSN